MKLSNKLTIAAVTLVVGFGAIQREANAASFEMIKNGEFEETQGQSNWLRTKNVPGWETTDEDSEFELWNEGKIGSPQIGSDGLGTGKHLETNLDGIAKISQTFKLGENIDNKAIFSFDAWSRANGTGIVSVFGSLSGSILNTAISMNGNSWTQNLFNLSVKRGEEITIAFQGDQSSSVASPHIDQVSFMVKPTFSGQAVPEPTSILGMLAFGAFGTASTLKHKKKQEA